MPEKLLVIWSSGDREVALKMVFMYTANSRRNNWWQQIQLLIWGPSARLAAEDEELQNYLRNMKNEGVELTACKSCADSYGVSAELEELGVEVKYMGQPLTSMLKNEWKVITF